MPGASGAVVGDGRRIAERAAEHALDLRRAAGRPAAAASARRGRRRWWIRRRPAPARRRRSGRCGRADRPARARALVGETWPERLADGATTGRPNAASRMSRATGWPGTRTAIAVEPGRRQLGHRAIRPLRQHQRQRPRPERGRQPLGRGVEHARARAPPRRRPHGRSAD